MDTFSSRSFFNAASAASLSAAFLLLPCARQFHADVMHGISKILIVIRPRRRDDVIMGASGDLAREIPATRPWDFPATGVRPVR